VIIDAARTLIGKGRPGGALSVIHPVDLHVHAVRALIDRVGIDPKPIDDVISGAVGQIGEQSLNTAWSAVLAAGLPKSVSPDAGTLSTCLTCQNPRSAWRS
jgi:acetyl-CoA acyltransferase